MKRLIVSLVALLASLALVVPAAGAAPDKVTLHPRGFGDDTYAAWKAKEGQPDSKGNANHALYFQKFADTFEPPAAIAEFQGVEGLPITAIEGLEWEHRNDGWCGAGAPRWTTISKDETGRQYVTHQGCAAAVHSPGSEPGWTRDTQPSPPAGALCVGLDPVEVFPTGCPDTTIVSLQIIFDEGTTIGGMPLGPGFVYLDNIKLTVNGTPYVWTGPMDNAA